MSGILDSMSGTTSRALSLLTLLQTHRHWRCAELAERLEVTERTVRRDVERLRELGYRVESTPGAAGGYRLEAGRAVPPLLLTDAEAVAIAVGLRVAASQRVTGGPETTLTALAKLEQVLPARVRGQVNALADAVHPAGLGGGVAVSTEVLGELALACRDHERVWFAYTSASGVLTRRRVEPHALAPAERHWYLLCWDLDRDDWRTFRVDRLEQVEHTNASFTPRPLTPEQVEEFVLVARNRVRQPVEADVVMALPLDAMREAFGPWARGATAEDADHTRWPIGGADVRDAMVGLSWIPAGVAYATDLPEPSRGQLRALLRAMLKGLDAPVPPARPAGAGQRPRAMSSDTVTNQ